jgi:hypothetical protein
VKRKGRARVWEGDVSTISVVYEPTRMRIYTFSLARSTSDEISVFVRDGIWQLVDSLDFQAGFGMAGSPKPSQYSRDKKTQERNG